MKTRLPALCCALLLLVSCVGRDAPTGEAADSYQVYFASLIDLADPNFRVGGPALSSETRRVPDKEGLLNGLMECLLSGPISDELASPFPEGVRQLEVPTLEDGVCRVNLSERYGSLSGMDLTVADYCITLTLCQAPGVEGVIIDVEGQPISYRAERDRPDLRASDVILSSAEDEPIYLSVDLYYLRRAGGLSVEEREVLVPGGSTPAAALLEALLSGPTDPELYLPIPEGAGLISAWVENDGTCYVDFDAPFLNGTSAPVSQSRQLLYAIVNTLCQLPNVNTVQLLVNGKSPETYGGVPTSSPLEPNQDMVVKERMESAAASISH